MSAVLDLLRPDLRDFAGYPSARKTQARGSVWLNANESPSPSPADEGRSLHRYPDPQPAELRSRLAGLYQVDVSQLMVTRGSDEGIDLLVRAFCRAGRDAVLVAPPCFGMYAVCARIQGAPLVELPLDDSNGTWSLDLAAVVKAVALQGVRLVFLSSPANPTGQALPLEQIRWLAQAIDGRAVLVIDEAYAEFSAQESACALVADFPALVVLRTLSKAHALAGARIGALIARPEVIGVLGNLSAPYPIAEPSALVALRALAPDSVAESLRRCGEATARRDALARRLGQLPCVGRVHPSDGNFLLVRFHCAEAAYARLLGAGIVVRDVRAMPGLGDALRISIGSDADCELVLATLAAENGA